MEYLISRMGDIPVVRRVMDRKGAGYAYSVAVGAHELLARDANPVQVEDLTEKMIVEQMRLCLSRNDNGMG